VQFVRPGKERRLVLVRVIEAKEHVQWEKLNEAQVDLAWGVAVS